MRFFLNQNKKRCAWTLRKLFTCTNWTISTYVTTSLPIILSSFLPQMGPWSMWYILNIIAYVDSDPTKIFAQGPSQIGIALEEHIKENHRLYQNSSWRNSQLNQSCFPKNSHCIFNAGLCDFLYQLTGLRKTFSVRWICMLVILRYVLSKNKQNNSGLPSHLHERKFRAQIHQIYGGCTEVSSITVFIVCFVAMIPWNPHLEKKKIGQVKHSSKHILYNLPEFMSKKYGNNKCNVVKYSAWFCFSRDL